MAGDQVTGPNNQVTEPNLAPDAAAEPPAADAVAEPLAQPAHHAADARSGALFAAGAAVLFGSAYVATAFQLRSFSPLAGAFWRSLLALIVLAGIVAVGALPARPAIPVGVSRVGRLVRLATLGVFGGLVFLVGMNVAVGLAGATITSFVAGLYAILAAVLGWLLLGERLSRFALAGFAVALVGTALLAELNPGSPSVPGLVAGLVAALSFALYLVLTRRWSRRYGLAGPTIALANFAAGSAGLLGFLAVTNPASILPASPAPASVVALAWLVLASVGGQLFVIASVRRIDARRSSAFLLFNPITATILSALLLGERLAPIQLAGGALVLAGMAMSSGLLVWARR